MPVDELEKALKELNQRLDKLDEETPMISSRAMARAAKRIEAGEYVYEVDLKKKDT